MFRIILCLAIFLTACAERGVIGFAQPHPDATLHEVFAANFRPNEPPAPGDVSPPRPKEITYEKYQISVPPNHTTGKVNWPAGRPDAATDMVATGFGKYQNPHSFLQDIQTRADSENEVVVFVHGFNSNHAEALYLLTQVKHDFEIGAPTVLFSWPSAARPIGYLYDRDSALIARDQLEEVLVKLSAKHKVVILAHSMGNFLVMETLRQIAQSGSMDIAESISTLIMISPDIDGELFFTQAASIPELPEATAVLVAERDAALRVSAWLTGRENRLGSDIDRSTIGGLPIIVIDVSAFSDGQLNHNVPLQSPAAIAVLSRLSRERLPSELRAERVIRIRPESPESD